MLPGDRLPDVRLQPFEGGSVTLHGRFSGAPLWLLVDVSQVEEAPSPPEDVRALRIVVGEDARAFADDCGWRVLVGDPVWCGLFEPGVLYRCDANLRILGCHQLPLAEAAAGKLTNPLESTDTFADTPVPVMAPVLQIPNVFEPGLCEEIIRHLDHDCGGGEPSGVLVVENGKERRQLDPTIKQRRESPPRDPTLEARMHERLLRRALPEIDRVFQFQVKRRDPFKLLAYPADAGYFHPHRDNDTPDVAYRRFALSVNLNAGGYDGGEFCYPEFGPYRFSPATGTALVFSCSLLHRVLPVRRGTRYAMTTFLA